MAVVMTLWRRGATSYLSGTRFGSQGSKSAWGCGTLEGFGSCYWVSSYHRPLYITEGCYNTLNDGEKAYARTHGAGCVANTGYYESYQYSGYTRYRFLPSAIIPYPDEHPCKDVSCPDMCVGVDKFDGVCDGGVCVKGMLIETNAVNCGYTPEPEPDPTPSPSSDMYIIVALMLAMTYIILRR